MDAQDRQYADHPPPRQNKPPRRARSESTPPRNGMHFYVYRTALDRGNVLRLVEERVKTSAGSVHSATYRTNMTWKNTSYPATAGDTDADPRVEASRYADSLNADPGRRYLQCLPDGVVVVGVVRQERRAG